MIYAGLADFYHRLVSLQGFSHFSHSPITYPLASPRKFRIPRIPLSPALPPIYGGREQSAVDAFLSSLVNGGGIKGGGLNLVGFTVFTPFAHPLSNFSTNCFKIRYFPNHLRCTKLFWRVFSSLFDKPGIWLSTFRSVISVVIFNPQHSSIYNIIPYEICSLETLVTLPMIKFTP